MNCPKCLFENPPGLIFCGRCGTRLEGEKGIVATPTLTMEKPLDTLAAGSLAEFEKSAQARDYLIPVFLESLVLLDLPWIGEFTSSSRFRALRAKIKK
jgi:hypothetical protein